MKFNEKWGVALVAFLFGLMVVTGIGQGALAQAQTMTIMQPQSTCFSPAYNLRFGSNDWSTGASVTQLQSYLTSQGYFNSSYIGSGRYGSLTLRAVAQFQAAHGLPASGYFGPMTRALVQQLSCGTVVVPPTQSISIYSVTPTSGAVGTTVSITGFGFTNDNTIHFGYGVVMHVPITSSVAIACTTNSSCHGGINQTLTFTVPSTLDPACRFSNPRCMIASIQTQPGTYPVSVENSNGTSNTLYFTITDSTTNNNQLSINGLSTPASLSLGQQGTWTVNALSNGAGNLHYSVTWGDEVTYGSSIIAPQTTSVQSSASFTHTYSRSGTYTPVFTVTDDSGHSVSASNTIVVQPIY